MIRPRRELSQKLLSLFRRRQLESDLDAELATHIEFATEDLVRNGMNASEARRQALMKLGGVEQAKEGQRDARGLPKLESTLQDIRYAARSLRHDAGFAIFAVLIVGLGVGASATVFSVLNTLLLKPLPFREPQKLAWIANRTDAEEDMSGQTTQVQALLDLRERSSSFSDVAGYFAFYGVGDVSLTGRGDPERLTSVPVSQNFFPVLGVQPVLGRQFSADESKWNGPKTAMLTYGLWSRRFAADRNIVGKVISLDSAPVTVVGVLPESFDFSAVFAPGSHIDLFTPFPLSPETNRWGNTMAIIGRMKDGVSVDRARAETATLGKQITADHPGLNTFDPTVAPLREHVSGRLRPALAILSCAVAVVMMIVCANLSNLMLARTAARQKEMAVRAALGATRARLVRQLLTESLLLTAVGALLAFGIALTATRGISHLTAFKIPLLTEVRVDGGVLAFLILVAIGTGLLLGIAPALQVSGFRLNASLGERSANGGHDHAFLRSALVVSEIAFACMLLVVAGLLTRSFLQVLDVNLGFQPETASTLRIDPSPQYKTKAQQNGYLNEVLRLARDVPGVEAAGLVDSLPLSGNRTWGAGAKGKVYTPANYPSAFVRLSTDGYLRAMGIPLTKGRDLSERDTTESAPVMLINETMARTVWPGEDPIGKFVLGDCAKERQVVGVVRDVRHMALEKASGSEMYIPYRQCSDIGSWDLVVRSRLPLPVLSSRLEAALRPIAPDLPKKSLRPLTQLVDRAVSPRRFVVMLLSSFAVFALLLASLGIYGVISYSVYRRTQEIGIRMALGASSLDVQGRIVLRTLGLAAVGMVVGVVGAAGLARALSTLLFGVTPVDPATYAASALVLVGIAALAGYLPAQRASRIDPMICLRAS